MSSKYNVIWAHVAENDMKNIIEYIADKSPQNALKILTEIRQKALSPDAFPERGRVAPELQDEGILIYRELVIAPWRLIYRNSGQEIFVLSVIDSRRNVEDILFKRFVDKE
ncbi:MAG: type II toxin-antitoxin system RelE/ParE family toxin [Proteobacteria bacterium]|nr:type II toxin-antitoxin system RelE/ParE family toxin [Pseudomonadota bacterium]